VIFLDVDGVLNDAAWIAACHAPCAEKWRELDPAKVWLLNEIIRRTGAVVVLSSAWRVAHTVDEVQGFLERTGFIGQIIDRTPRDPRPGNHRGDEIREWLAKATWFKGRWIVIDDSEILNVGYGLVRTTNATGLQPEHVEAAVELLDG
jgi:hypothetical protein